MGQKRLRLLNSLSYEGHFRIFTEFFTLIHNPITKEQCS